MNNSSFSQHPRHGLSSVVLKVTWLASSLGRGPRPLPSGSLSMLFPPHKVLFPAVSFVMRSRLSSS